MKEILSAGGPLIGLDRDNLGVWTGVFGKRFIGEDSPFESDYEAACRSGRSSTGRIGLASKICGLTAEGILIESPNNTAVIEVNKNSIYIIQVEYCEPEWGLHLVGLSYFDDARFDKNREIVFSCKTCSYILFDAAYAGHNVGDDYLEFDIEGGEHVLSAATCRPDDKTGLILCKISKREAAA